MRSPQEFLAESRNITEEFRQKFSSDAGVIGALSARVVTLLEDIEHLRNIQNSNAIKRQNRINRGNIDGICQRLADEMQYFADNEVTDEGGREEILDTIRVYLKKIDAVSLNTPEPDDGSDYAYESMREAQVCRGAA